MLSFKDITFLEKNKKARDTQGLFVAEGRKLFFEAPPDRIVQVLMTRRFAEEHPEAFEKIPAGTDVVADIDETRFFQLSDTRTPQGILTVLKKMDWRAEDVLGIACPLYAILENLQDPGNVGTILRTADAFGADGVFLINGCADLYNPKTVRSTMGAVFRCPVWNCTAVELRKLLSASNLPLYGAALRADTLDARAVDYSRCAIAIGSEGKGLCEEMLSLCDQTILILMRDHCESLNAAIAASVLLWEAYRGQ
jgi:TrmH family RNA methyltransferase